MAAAILPATGHAQPAGVAPAPPAASGADPLALDDLPDLGVDWPDLDTPAAPLPDLPPVAAGPEDDGLPDAGPDETQLTTPEAAPSSVGPMRWRRSIPGRRCDIMSRWRA